MVAAMLLASLQLCVKALDLLEHLLGCGKHAARALHIAPGKTAMGRANYLKLAFNMLTKGDPKA